MNYIKKLEAQTAAQVEQILDTKDFVNYLWSYLQSDKFHEDSTVQVQDVLNRLASVRDCLSDAYFDIKMEKYQEMV
jgi:hypothetical protein